MSKRVVVAMSGGVDSSVVAWMLKEQGYEPIGLFMRNGVESPAKASQSKSCCSIYDAKDARMVAGDLGIPFHAMDLSSEFGRLINYFSDEYVSGRTPNPCAVCNRDLKFGKLYEFARQLGAEWLATGHYARLDRDGGRLRLRRAVDRKKDQSYQLFDVAKVTLEKSLFPLGEMEKGEVRALAQKAGLPVFDKPDSQEICFVPTNDYRDLLEERGVKSAPGSVIDKQGKLLAKHDGVANFTIGQRRGVGVAAGEPRYVIELDAKSGNVVLGSRDECLFHGVKVGQLNWIQTPLDVGTRRDCIAQIRYRHPGRSGKLCRVSEKSVEFYFDEPELAVTPGQAAVFYDGEELLGGGWIESGMRKDLSKESA